MNLNIKDLLKLTIEYVGEDNKKHKTCFHNFGYIDELTLKNNKEVKEEASYPFDCPDQELELYIRYTNCEVDTD